MSSEETDVEFLERMRDRLAANMGDDERGEVPMSAAEAGHLFRLAERGARVPDHPTMEMLETGRKASKSKRLHVSHAASDEFIACAVVYRAMIRTALGEKE